MLPIRWKAASAGACSSCMTRSGDDKIPLLHDTLAQMLAIPDVTLTARTLEKDGGLICCRGYMQIASRDELQRRSCECCGRVKGYIERLHAAHQWEDVARLEFSEPCSPLATIGASK